MTDSLAATRKMIQRFHDAFESGQYYDFRGKPATILTLYVEREEVAAAIRELGAA